MENSYNIPSAFGKKIRSKSFETPISGKEFGRAESLMHPNIGGEDPNWI